MNNAEGVHVFNSLDSITPVISQAEQLFAQEQSAGGRNAQKHRMWVLQQHCDAPLLLQGRKFHVRVNVLALGALLVYVHDDAVVHVASEPYYCGSSGCGNDGNGNGSNGDANDNGDNINDKDNYGNDENGSGGDGEESRRCDWGNRWAHITNHIVQRDHPAYDGARQCQLLKDALKTLCPACCSESRAAAAAAAAAATAASESSTENCGSSSSDEGAVPVHECQRLFARICAVVERTFAAFKVGSAPCLI